MNTRGKSGIQELDTILLVEQRWLATTRMRVFPLLQPSGQQSFWHELWSSLFYFDRKIF